MSDGRAHEAFPVIGCEGRDCERSRFTDGQGSIMLLVLFACLAVTVVIQSLCTVIICAERATVDETVGRMRLEEKDRGLTALRQRALTAWEPMTWAVVAGSADPQAGTALVEGSLCALDGSRDRLMHAVVRQETCVSRLMISAWLERGRDGLDLPLAALVAGRLKADPGRTLPWLSLDSSIGAEIGGSPADVVGYVVTPPEAPLLGDGSALVALGEPWRLDPGWSTLGVTAEAGDATSSGSAAGSGGDTAPLPAAAPSAGTTVLTGRSGRTLRIPNDIAGVDAGSPALIVVTGGADLDARNRGDLFGVLVVDDGSVWLDGTTVHGAVFVTGTMDLGETGCLLYSRTILRWATDRSLCRTRLVPATRWEGME